MRFCNFVKRIKAPIIDKLSQITKINKHIVIKSNVLLLYLPILCDAIRGLRHDIYLLLMAVN